MLAAGPTAILAQTPSAAPPTAESPVTTDPAPPAEAPKISNDQLDSLVAPIALYSDQLLAMTLAASTYPLEIIQLQQWMERNKNTEGQGADRCGGEAAMGPERSITDRIPRFGEETGWKYPMDGRPGECLPVSANRCDGRDPTHAREGGKQRRLENQLGAKSLKQDDLRVESR